MGNSQTSKQQQSTKGVPFGRNQALLPSEVEFLVFSWLTLADVGALSLVSNGLRTQTIEWLLSARQLVLDVSDLPQLALTTLRRGSRTPFSDLAERRCCSLGFVNAVRIAAAECKALRRVECTSSFSETFDGDYERFLLSIIERNRDNLRELLCDKITPDIVDALVQCRALEALTLDLDRVPVLASSIRKATVESLPQLSSLKVMACSRKALESAGASLRSLFEQSTPSRVCVCVLIHSIVQISRS